MKSLSFKKVGFAFFLMVLILSLVNVSLAQSRRTGWRCPGNVFTNDQNLVRKLGNCEELNVTLTVMNPGGGTSGGGGGGGATQARPANTNMQVSSGAQQRRDSDAKKLIEAELSKKQSELAMLQSQYNSGSPERLLVEAKDEVAYQARVDRLSREIEKKVAEIASIQNELSRL